MEGWEGLSLEVVVGPSFCKILSDLENVLPASFLTLKHILDEKVNLINCAQYG